LLKEGGRREGVGGGCRGKAGVRTMEKGGRKEEGGERGRDEEE
jgi:hypothetical protein